MERAALRPLPVDAMRQREKLFLGRDVNFLSNKLPRRSFRAFNAPRRVLGHDALLQCVFEDGAQDGQLIFEGDLRQFVTPLCHQSSQCAAEI
jgi:hypothetical protein